MIGEERLDQAHQAMNFRKLVLQADVEPGRHHMKSYVDGAIVDVILGPVPVAHSIIQIMAEDGGTGQAEAKAFP